MDEVAGLDRFKSVPDTARHDVRVAGTEENFRLDSRRSSVTIVKNQFHGSTDDVKELVTVRVDFTSMRSRSLDTGDRSDRVSVDSTRWSWRSGGDGH